MKMYLDPMHTIVNNKGEKVEKLLSRFGVQVVNEVGAKSKKNEQVHAFIIDGRENTSENAFVSALAIAENKKILCFLPKGHRLPQALAMLHTNPVLKKKLFLLFYTPITLTKVVQTIVKKLDTGQLKEKPAIKFTLRITPSMERYLEWKSQQMKESKADFLRKVIQEKIINKDKGYTKMID